jgi:hypothetical protein
MPDHPVLERLGRVLAETIMGFGLAEQAFRRKGFDHFPLQVLEFERVFSCAPFLAVWVGERSQAKVLQESSIDGIAPQLLTSMQRAMAAGARHG